MSHITAGKGRTLEAAIEAALDKSGVQPPYCFDVIKLRGAVSPEKELSYSAEVHAHKVESLEGIAALRSGGTGELDGVEGVTR